MSDNFDLKEIYCALKNCGIKCKLIAGCVRFRDQQDQICEIDEDEDVSSSAKSSGQRYYQIGDSGGNMGGYYNDDCCGLSKEEVIQKAKLWAGQ